MEQRYDVHAGSRPAPGRRRGLLCVAVAAALVTAACTAASEPTSAPAQSAPSAHTSTASRTPCPYSDSAAAGMGTRLLDIVSAEVAGSYTDQFRDLRAVLVNVCGKPALQHYVKSTSASYHTVASV